MSSIYVQVPAFEEPEVHDTLRRIKEQAPAAPGTVTVEAWVTRSEDESGVCSTWQSAQSVPGVGVFEAPSGKLSARNAAHNHALSSGADVIVSWDADAPPVGGSVLSAVAEPALRPGVSLVNSRPVASDGSILGSLIDAGGRAEDVLRPHAHGQCHAFPASTWEQVGPFNEALDQTNPYAVRQEEEFRFYTEARAIGEVVTADDATVFNDPRRHYCYLPGMEDDDYCVTLGEDTF